MATTYDILDTTEGVVVVSGLDRDVAESELARLRGEADETITVPNPECIDQAHRHAAAVATREAAGEVVPEAERATPPCQEPTRELYANGHEGRKREYELIEDESEPVPEPELTAAIGILAEDGTLVAEADDLQQLEDHVADLTADDPTKDYLFVANGSDVAEEDLRARVSTGILRGQARVAAADIEAAVADSDVGPPEIYTEPDWSELKTPPSPEEDPTFLEYQRLLREANEQAPEDPNPTRGEADE